MKTDHPFISVRERENVDGVSEHTLRDRKYRVTPDKSGAEGVGVVSARACVCVFAHRLNVQRREILRLKSCARIHVRDEGAFVRRRGEMGSECKLALRDARGDGNMAACLPPRRASADLLNSGNVSSVYKEQCGLIESRIAHVSARR